MVKATLWGVPSKQQRPLALRLAWPSSPWSRLSLMPCRGPDTACLLWVRMWSKMGPAALALWGGDTAPRAGVPPGTHPCPRVWDLEFTVGSAAEGRDLAYILEWGESGGRLGLGAGTLLSRCGPAGMGRPLESRHVGPQLPSL